MTFGLEQLLIGVSMALQFGVATMAIRRAMTSMSAHRITWATLAVVFTLMGLRRLVSLLISFDLDIPFAFPEFIAFIISVLLAFSVYNIGKILPALENIASRIPGTSEQLKDIAANLSAELEGDLANLDDYKTNGEKLERSKQRLNTAGGKLVDIAHNLERLTSGQVPPDDMEGR